MANMMTIINRFFRAFIWEDNWVLNEENVWNKCMFQSITWYSAALLSCWFPVSTLTWVSSMCLSMLSNIPCWSWTIVARSLNIWLTSTMFDSNCLMDWFCSSANFMRSLSTASSICSWVWPNVSSLNERVVDSKLYSSLA